LYVTAGKDRLLHSVRVRDPQGKRPDPMFSCTRLGWDARQILGAYACRWSIAVTFANSKPFLGLEDPANRLPLAVRRTAPLALVLYSLIVVWFQRLGHGWLRFPDRPWYKRKAEPSFADLLSTLRRVRGEEQFRGVRPGSSPHKNLLAQVIDFVNRTGERPAGEQESRRPSRAIRTRALGKTRASGPPNAFLCAKHEPRRPQYTLISTCRRSRRSASRTIP
jgi:hypothetical protein